MKVAVIINNDGSSGYLVNANSTTEAIEKIMQHCIINKITVYKVIAYFLIEL